MIWVIEYRKKLMCMYIIYIYVLIYTYMYVLMYIIYNLVYMRS